MVFLYIFPETNPFIVSRAVTAKATEVVPAPREPAAAKPRDAAPPRDDVAAEWPGQFGCDGLKTEHQMGNEDLEAVTLRFS